MMPVMETGDIKHLASLSRIRITEEEAEHLKTDIEAVLEYVSVVSEIASDESAAKKVGARFNVFRKDEVTNEPGSYTEEILSEVPNREGNYIKVKKIINQD